MAAPISWSELAEMVATFLISSLEEIILVRDCERGRSGEVGGEAPAGAGTACKERRAKGGRGREGFGPHAANQRTRGRREEWGRAGRGAVCETTSRRRGRVAP